MGSRVSPIAATVIFVVALIGVAIWFHGGGGAACALADFAQPIIDARNTTFTMTTEGNGQRGAPSKVFVLDSQRMRFESSGEQGIVIIVDLKQGRHLALEPKKAKATLHKIDVSTKGAAANTFYFFSDLRTMLGETRDKPEAKRESLGEKEIEGHRAVGHRITYRGRVTEIWSDPKTDLPILVEQTTPPHRMKIIMSDFAFHQKLDASLFSTDPPSGYTMVQADILPGTEEDLLAALRTYSGLFNGVFPDALDTPSMYGRWIEKTAHKGPPSQEELEQGMELGALFTRAVGFVGKLPRTCNARYAGKGVSCNAAKRPIFWYRPKDAKEYRVIYSDLSIRDAKAPPRVANAQPLPAKKKPVPRRK